MKKMMVIAAMMMVVLGVKAQYEPGTWSLQPKLGITVSSLTNMEKMLLASDVALDKTPLGGATAGIDVEYQVAKFLGLSAGISVSMQGQGWKNYKGNLMGENVEVKDPKFELSYFNIPILANIYLFKGLAVKAGVQFGFLTSANVKYTIEGTTDFGDNVKRDITQNNSIGMKNECKKIDISVPVGLSYEFNNHLVLDARYNIGISKVNKESIPGEKDNKNGCFMLTLGYKVSL